MRTSALLAEARVVHGFGDRTLGVSEGIYARGNAGLSTDDDPAAVRANRALFAEALGCAPQALTTAKQVHGTTALVVEAPEQGMREADALVSATPGLLLAVTSADCVPLLLADPMAGVVAAVHAGWRGAVAGVVEGSLERMVERGASPARTIAAIGPAIRQSSYEVDPPFRDAVLAQRPSAEHLFTSTAKPARWNFDLPALVGAILAEFGVGRLDDLGLDTLNDSSIYFSYRRSVQRGEGGYGVQLTGIRVPG